MKIKSTITGALYEFNAQGKIDEERYICPECSHLRKKKNDKCLAWNTKENVGYCHNCTASFYVFNPQQKEYTAPEWKNKTELTDIAVRYFTGRMISQKTLIKMRLYSDNEFMPQLNKACEVICFPFFFQERLVNIKYRGEKKSFKLHAGAELIFYNQDALLNNEDIIIVEGEIDALSFIECGFDNVISVPNGAGGKHEYLDTYINLFDNIKRVYLAVDQDTKGIELRDELARRLGQERCFIVNFKDCKDANAYICKYGGADMGQLIKDAQPVPVKGIIFVPQIEADIRQMFDVGFNPGLTLGDTFDNNIKWETRRLATVSGIPSHGKSEFVDYLIVKLNLIYGWKAALFTPENYPLSYHYVKLFEKIIGKKFNKQSATDIDYDMAYEHISNNFFYILNEDDFTVDSLLLAAKSLVRSKGIKVLVVDPYNRLDHQYTESETQYISKFLDKLTMFARIYDVLVFLVAHPRKIEKEGGAFRVPSVYDIAGSSNFANKSDYIFTVYRKVDGSGILMNEVEIYWQKIKHKYLGETGITALKYEKTSGRFFSSQPDTNNWLIKKAEQQIISYSEPTDKMGDEYFDNSMPTF